MARNYNKRNGGAGGGKGTAELLNYTPTGKLLHWVEPAVSGGCLVVGLILLVSLNFYSSICITSNLLLLGVMLGVGSKMYVHLMGMLKKPCKDPLAQLALIDMTVSPDCVDGLVKSSAEAYNHYASMLQRLLLGEDLYASLKFLTMMYLGTMVGAVFNTLTLITIGWVAAFILPKIYEDNQDSMDDLYYKVVDQYAAVDAKIAAVFPGQPKQAEAQAEETKEE